MKMLILRYHTCTRVKERGGKVCFPPLLQKFGNFSPPVWRSFPPLIFPPYFNFLTIFPYITPPFGILKKVFPPSAEGGRNFFKIFPFFQIFSQKFNFPKASPQKKVKKIFPKEKFSPPIYSFEVIFLPPFMISSGGFFLPPEKFQ